MRSFISTPLFRLLTVLVNCALIFPVIGFGLSVSDARNSGNRTNFNSFSPELFDLQMKKWKAAGILPKDSQKSEQKPPTQSEKEKQVERNSEQSLQEDNKNDASLKSLSEIPKNGQPSPDESRKRRNNSVALSGAEEQPASTTDSATVKSDTVPVQNPADARATNKPQPSDHRQSYSSVKNLPDAEKIRNTTDAAPHILAPVPSTQCLLGTVNCPSNVNREVLPDTARRANDGERDKSIFSTFGGSFLNGDSSRSLHSLDDLLAFSGTSDETLPFFDNLPATAGKSALNSDVVPGAGLFGTFKNVEMYNPSAPASYSATAAALLLPPGGNGTVFDFDGDGKSDISVWRPDTGSWYVLRSSDGNYDSIANFGLGGSGDQIVPGNYDGDAKTDYAYWRPATGVWTIKQSSNNQTVTYTLGQSGDLIVPGDYDGDGKIDCAVFRTSNGTWYYRKSSDGSVQSQSWGYGNDVPVVGDFDGDGKADFTVVRASDNNWYILQSSNGSSVITWGTTGDRLVPGDYDGDGKTDVGVWRESTNTWYIRKSSTGVLQALSYGGSGDYPVPADYDGDGKTDCAVWRSSNGYWYITKSGNGTQFATGFGAAGDIPVPSAYVRYFSSSNQNPTANAGGPYNATVNNPIQLNGQNSSDSDGQIYGYNWNFGDGSQGTGMKPSHIYTSVGVYNVTLSVTDNQGSVSTLASTTASVTDTTNARLDPFNAVGSDNIISGNFNWSAGLVNLPGRAGMNAGLSLSYNSLVWLRQTSGTNASMVFDPDSGFPGPGFRLGMPVIESAVTSPQTGKNYFLMISESGSRIEFRQVGSSNIYETADSSYSQLQANGNSLLVRTTDGTQSNYQLINGRYQCTSVIDRNGNYITATYNGFGRLATMTDTLGRVIVINYDANGNPLSVAQSYDNQQPRVYATFGYGTTLINTNFNPSVSVVGPADDTSITVLKQVAFDDGSYYSFDYNSFGQVKQINNYAPDGHKLNHVRYELGGTGSDCPRIVSREDYAENWMTVTTSYNRHQAATWTMPDTNQGESGLVSSITAPDGTTNKYYYHSFGWDKGIPLLVETSATSNGSRERWSMTHLTQDNTNVSYISNPRTTVSAVGDAGNVRKSSISYGTLTLPSGTIMYLPNDTFQYRQDGSIYRHAQTDYNFDSQYVNRYIIGLQSETRLYEGSGTSSMLKRESIAYDETATTDLPNVIQHDNTYYGTSLTYRGNPTTLTRWNINAGEPVQSLITQVGYNIAGDSIYTQDPAQTAQKRIQYDYADSFTDNISRNTYAYLSKVTDPDGFTATTKTHFLSGLTDQFQGALAGQSTDANRGAIEKSYYDSIDRLIKSEVLYPNGTSSGAYRRYSYPSASDPNTVKIYTKLDTNLGEGLSFMVLDGSGRVRASASELSETGKWSGQLYEYNNVGKLWKSSLRAETSASGSTWTTTGDDAATGWLYETNTFDWKGRPLVSTHTDGTTQEIMYEGCGCAGGQTVITRDEIGRREKVSYDEFGRHYKTQVLPQQAKTETLNGSGTPYSTKIDVYNALDQITATKVYAGTETSDGSCPISIGSNDGCRLSTTDYDGFSRVWKTHTPEMDTNSYITRSYYDDGTLHEVTDARGVKQTITYTPRKQVYQINYTTVGSIPNATGTVNTYDAVGNRLSMNASTYTYDQLSRLISETKKFGRGQSFQIPVGTQYVDTDYTINYQYYSAGSLKKIYSSPNPTNLNYEVNYTIDKIGRETSVSKGSSPIISGAQYRATGLLKQQSYGNGTSLEISYNNRLQPSQYNLKKGSGEAILSKNYKYTTTDTSNDNDGTMKISENLQNSKLTRRLEYDFAGRLSHAKAGNTINQPGTPANGQTDGPFDENYGYNPFGEQISLSERTWTSNGYCNNCPTPVTTFKTIINGRDTATGFEYDANGQLTRGQSGSAVFNYSYDAANRSSLVATPSSYTQNVFDGDGKVVGNGTAYAFFNSTLLDTRLLEIRLSNNNGLNGPSYFERSYIYNSRKERIAKNESQTLWLHSDLTGENNREINSSGNVTNITEIDPLGGITSDSSLFNYSGQSSNNSGSSNGGYGGAGVGFYLSAQERFAFSPEAGQFGRAEAALAMHQATSITIDKYEQKWWGRQYGNYNENGTFIRTRYTALEWGDWKYVSSRTITNNSSVNIAAFNPGNSNSMVQQQQQKKDRPYSRETLVKCIHDIYHVEVDLSTLDDDASTDHTWKLSGTYSDPDNWFDWSVAIETDSDTFKAGDLGLMSGDRPFAYGMTYEYTWTNWAKFWDRTQRNHNYVASDWKDMVAIAQRTWVYELGNALTQQTQFFPPVDPKDAADLPVKKDVGSVLEKCVYGNFIPEKQKAK